MQNKFIFFMLLVVSTFVPFTATAKSMGNGLNNYEQLMVGKVWETTEALDQNKMQIDAKDTKVANFFGLAEYYADGTFKITTFEGKPKLHGDWSFSDDGKTRSLTAKNDKGDVLFVRVVENVTVTSDEYTYRIYPEKDNKKVFFDIVHKVKK
ncbi:hypothetical protein QV06_02270 [Gallibacterium genomosp. 3]|uniref:DUF4822 domain-containing protein n=1 Tax=Gallibacterium genomosp. 3 TaxID=505345 RepID=A0A1A7NWQ7_9PAST|nr:DUF4822 domain-containing protein [Gallibacterium genomosp. 3]OBW94015.1 hypothetical protein QV01_00470 [Gallibacterium genomosp. 3]OBX05471.1 hypothetical protein QV06_02270 [Gallibacterium genomosp. 3]